MDAVIDALKHTPLYQAHVDAGARMVPFAGYEMPVQYAGVMAEHKHCREAAGLFDVSHMGQAWLRGAGAGDTLESITPTDVAILKPGRQKYGLLMNDEGGIIDDMMISRPAGEDDAHDLFIVVNGACKDKDFAHISSKLADDVSLEIADDRALLALQGPQAVDILAQHISDVTDMKFMDACWFDGFGTRVIISRSGYTGMDGFELSVPANKAVEVWHLLCGDDRVMPIGLGARDSLRLEAGLPLYGHDIDGTTSPVEADLKFAVNKARRERADFPGAGRVMQEWADGPIRTRIGLQITNGAPAREGADVATLDGDVIGRVTSGGFSPSLGHAIAMAYVKPEFAEAGTKLKAIVRGRDSQAQVVDLPFIPASFIR